jgi:pantoate--beta-alanine ligase
MDLLTSISAMRAWTASRQKEGRTIGFVPTMGALHEGHLSLVRTAARECAAMVTSIFVNPAQFGKGEDLDMYPRDLDGDGKLLEKAGCDALFTIEADAMYPSGFETWVDVENLPDHLCGLRRPGHFRGVTTVVSKLFNIVAPVRAYFGWKDAQQALIIRRMAQDLNFDVEIRILPIVRDSDGLALSSRNAYLSVEERRKAQLLPGAIEKAKRYYAAGGEDGKKLLNELESHFHGVEGVVLDYISLVDMEDLSDTEKIAPGTMLALAVRVGATRLIDNCQFTEDRSC